MTRNLFLDQIQQKTHQKTGLSPRKQMNLVQEAYCYVLRYEPRKVMPVDCATHTSAWYVDPHWPESSASDQD